MQQIHLKKPLEAACPRAVVFQINKGGTGLFFLEHKWRALFLANLI